VFFMFGKTSMKRKVAWKEIGSLRLGASNVNA
jgi:hypothetical protein